MAPRWSCQPGRVCQKFWVPFLDTVCTAGMGEGSGAQPAELPCRLCPRKPRVVGQVALSRSMADVPSEHTKQAPDAQLYCSFEVHARQYWQYWPVRAKGGEGGRGAPAGVGGAKSPTAPRSFFFPPASRHLFFGDTAL